MDDHRDDALGALAPMIADPIMNKRRTAQETNLSTATIDRLRISGDFPAPIKLSARRVGWRRSTIMAWLQTREMRRR